MQAQGSADPVASSEAGMSLQDYSRLWQWGQALYSFIDHSLDAATLRRGVALGQADLCNGGQLWGQ